MSRIITNNKIVVSDTNHVSKRRSFSSVKGFYQIRKLDQTGGCKKQIGNT